MPHVRGLVWFIYTYWRNFACWFRKQRVLMTWCCCKEEAPLGMGTAVRARLPGLKVSAGWGFVIPPFHYPDLQCVVFSSGGTQICNGVCGNKMPTRCNRGFYCRSYCLLNIFRAPLCPSSGAQEYYTVVAACGISCCGFQVPGLVRYSWAPDDGHSGARNMLSKQ